MHLTLRSPADFVAAIPYLLGFHPEQSLVFVWLHDDQIVLTQRIDAIAIDELLKHPRLVLEPGQRVAASEVVVTCYSGPAPSQSLSDRVLDLVPALEAGDVRVLDVLLAGPDWWRSVICREHCCTAGPRRLESGDRDRVATAFIADGVAVLDNREQLAQELAPDAALIARVTSDLPHDPDYPKLVRRCLTRWRAESRRVRFRDLVQHVAAARNIGARDALAWHLAQLSRDQLRPVGELLRQTVCAAPAGYVAPVATLAGLAAWLTGDGARALTALDRGLTDDPDYRLAVMVHAAISAGLPPGQWRAMLRSTPQEQVCARDFLSDPL